MSSIGSQTNDECGADPYCGHRERYNPRLVARAMEATHGKWDFLFSEPEDQRARVARSAHEVDPLQPELRPACANTTRVETPRIAVDSFGHLRMIINDDHYLQRVEVVECESSQTISGGVCQVPGSYVSRTGSFCKQIYQRHQLLAVNSHGREVVLDSFLYASGCTCYFEAD